MGTARVQRAALLAGALAALAPAAHADEAGETLHTLKNLNRHSSLEPAGARGSIGVGAGAGAMQVEAGATPAYRDVLGLGEGDEREAALVPRLWLTKGLPIPLDLGFAASKLTRGEGRATQAAGQLQWTVYEDFAMPALSVRYAHARLFGLERTKVRSDAVEALASYGFLRYFTVFGSIGAARHEATVFAADKSEDVSRTWNEPQRTFGMKIMVIPPFVTLGGEAQLAHGRASAAAAKITVGM